MLVLIYIIFLSKFYIYKCRFMNLRFKDTWKGFKICIGLKCDGIIDVMSKSKYNKAVKTTFIF